MKQIVKLLNIHWLTPYLPFEVTNDINYDESLDLTIGLLNSGIDKYSTRVSDDNILNDFLIYILHNHSKSIFFDLIDGKFTKIRNDNTISLKLIYDKNQIKSIYKKQRIDYSIREKINKTLNIEICLTYKK